MFYTLDEVKAAVNEGHEVFWTNGAYKVISQFGEYFVKCTFNNSMVGLTLAYKPEDFFRK